MSVRLVKFCSAAVLCLSALCTTGLAAGQPIANRSATLTDCTGSEFATLLHSEQQGQEQSAATAYWLSHALIRWPGMAANENFRLYYSHSGKLQIQPGHRVQGADDVLQLELDQSPLTPALTSRFKYIGSGADLVIPVAALKKIPEILRGQFILVQENQRGLVLSSTSLQIAGVLDDVFAAAQQVGDFGVTLSAGKTSFKLWAPTAQAVSLCTYAKDHTVATELKPMQRNADAGIWSVQQPKNLSGGSYQYLVDVWVPGVGVVRNRVTDPYSVSLNTDSMRSYIGDLTSKKLKPEGWDNKSAATPATVHAQTDMTVYELHVRDFSVNDQTVSAAHRGKYLAFTELASNGMQHLAALAKAGITDVHLLPVFDFASVPEKNCATPLINPAWSSSSDAQQAAVLALADRDCFNWGYDPQHYNAPEGSYATDPEDGSVRVLEFRQMVQALHRTGLRVGMDVVYNHTFTSGQKQAAVLDRIVPGYYQRLNAQGGVEHSTCCDNTATENAMMGKLLIDSVVSWAVNYHIDSFRFDLMAHQPRALMEKLQTELTRRTGHAIQLIGEGWNFGEVADGARFVQASQRSLNGSGIGTFNDRLRDAVRGGSSSDSGADLVNRKGYINGLAQTDLSAQATLALRQSADMVRVGLAGSLRDYPLLTQDGSVRRLSEIDYNGQPAGYVSEPGEVVNYVENHDNQTLFDLNVYKLPVTTSRVDRVRVQLLGEAIVAFSQGAAYFHAGIDILRSKSMDGNSFNSGDWFNRLDWRYQDNYFASGLPPKTDNGKNYALMQPLLDNALIKPGPDDIRLARDGFRELLQIRSSSTLFRMTSAADIRQRLRFDNTGPDQNAALIVTHLDGENYPGARFKDILYFINVANTTQTIVLDQEKAQHYGLHPVLCGNRRIKSESNYDPLTGTFTLPALAAVVFVQTTDLRYSCPETKFHP